MKFFANFHSNSVPWVLAWVLNDYFCLEHFVWIRREFSYLTFLVRGSLGHLDVQGLEENTAHVTNGGLHSNFWFCMADTGIHG